MVQSNYITYNKAVVTLICNNTEYIVSNVNTKGQPGADCGCHLKSLEIKAPAFESGNTNSVGTTGTVGLVDYKYSVFHKLISHMSHYLYNDDKTPKPETEVKKQNLCPKVKISLDCFSGSRSWEGWIVDWNYTFTGTAPEISLNFTCTNPGEATSLRSAEEESTELKSTDGELSFESPAEFVTKMQEKYGNLPELKVLSPDGSESIGTDGANKIIFINTPFKFRESSKCGLINAYMQLVKYCVFSVGGITGLSGAAKVAAEFGAALGGVINKLVFGTNDLLAGYISDDGKYFIITSKDKYKESPDDESYIFIQNGSTPAYDKLNGNYVIPMTSFNFNTNMKMTAIQSSILNLGENSQIIQRNDGTATTTTDTQEQANKADAQARTEANASSISVSFDCYNYIHFQRNNIDKKVKISVFDEFGDPVKYLNTDITIREVTYSLEGAVVKAHVEGTTVFNNLSGAPTRGSGNARGTNVEREKGGSGGNKKGGGNKKVGKGPNDNDPKITDSYRNYLKEEDEIAIPIEYDKTVTLVSNGIFFEHVDEFLDTYGTERGGIYPTNLDYKFIKKLIDAGNIGLLSLLMNIAHYGAKNYPSTWTDDPLKHDPWHKNIIPFTHGYEGKAPFRYTFSGLGIADFDVGKIGRMYTRAGFNENIDKDHLASVIVKSPESDSQGTVSGWKSITFSKDKNNPNRLVPIFKNAKGKVVDKGKWTKFDCGLKQDSQWREWAKYILNYKGDSKNPWPYQHLLFSMWVELFWAPIVKKLKTTQSKNNHIICLQDAVRFSRAVNSGSNDISGIYGDRVEAFYNTYRSHGDAEHCVKQHAYAKRVNAILVYELGDKYKSK